MGSVSHTMWASHAESEWKACARRQADKTAGWGQARSKWLVKQWVPLDLDQAVQMGGVHVVGAE